MALYSKPVVAYSRKNLPYSLILDVATGNDKNEGDLGAILCQTDQNAPSKKLLMQAGNY
jgi:hypothetical protein